MAEGSTQLDGFRDPALEADPADRVPALTPDNPDPVPAPQEPAVSIVREPAPEPKPTEPELPREITDPRAAMAARFRERRDRAHAEAQNVDPYAAPITAHVPGQKPEPAAEQATAPAPASAAPNYALKVHGREFEVSRADLLSAAGLSEEDADGVPDKALIRAAQINMAAHNRLEEAKSFNQTARLTERAAAPPQAEPPSQAAAPIAPPAGEPSDDDLMERIQLGDKQEALQAFDALQNRRLANQQHQARLATLSQDVNSALENFARSNPDIVGNDVAMDFHRTLSVREAVNELRTIGVPEHELAQLLNNQELTIRAYNGAREKGFNVAPPDELFARAATKARTALNMAPPQAAQSNPPPAFASRVEMKRALPSQPARSGSPALSAQSVQPAAPQRNPSATIAAMRKARFQD